MVFQRVLVAIATCVFATASVASASSNLPVIFFHGVFGNYRAGDNFVANLAAQNRKVVSLSFCDDSCSIETLLKQVPAGVEAVRAAVASDPVFDDGYIIMAHSQGGPIARAVIEEMDDHKAKRFISLAGLQNGQFIGPDKVQISIDRHGQFLNMLIPDKKIFDYSKYSPADYYGKMQKDFVITNLQHPQYQDTYSQFSVSRWPQFSSFASTNKFLPVYNNVNPCASGDNKCRSEQERRKANFLRLEQAHFFASPADDVIMPWQSCIFGRYSEVDTIDEIETKFRDLKIVDMKETLEYKYDTFGLRTLDERGALFTHVVPQVSHSCWTGDEGSCKFQPVYEQHIYPALN